MNRILFEHDEIAPFLSARDERARHMRSILRVEEGDIVEVGIVGGPRGTATITRISDDGIGLAFDLEDAGTADSPYPVTLLLGHPRPIVLKRILKDATTLGVERILVCATDTGEKSYLESTLWAGAAVRRQLIDGAAQAGVTFIPGVERLSTLGHGLDLLEESTQPTAGDWNLQLIAMDNQPFHPSLSRVELQSQRFVVAVGSERGWSDSERIQLRDRGFALYSLGPRVLRTETAVACSLGLVLSKIGVI